MQDSIQEMGMRFKSVFICACHVFLLIIAETRDLPYIFHIIGPGDAKNAPIPVEARLSLW